MTFMPLCTPAKAIRHHDLHWIAGRAAADPLFALVTAHRVSRLQNVVVAKLAAWSTWLRGIRCLDACIPHVASPDIARTSWESRHWPLNGNHMTRHMSPLPGMLSKSCQIAQARADLHFDVRILIGAGSGNSGSWL